MTATMQATTEAMATTESRPAKVRKVRPRRPTSQSVRSTRLAVLCRKVECFPGRPGADDKQTPRAARLWAALWKSVEGIVYHEAGRLHAIHNVEIGDAYGECFVSLRKCVNGFDRTFGVAFSTYFVRSIRWSVANRLKADRNLVRVPAYWERENQGREQPELVGRSVSMTDVFRDSLVDREGESPEDRESRVVRIERLMNAVAELDDRERAIIASRFELRGQPHKTLVAMGKELGVTKERIRQLEERALGKLKMALEGVVS